MFYKKCVIRIKGWLIKMIFKNFIECNLLNNFSIVDKIVDGFIIFIIFNKR